MKRIYISGKITGLDMLEATSNFQKAESFLIEKYGDIEVVNPMVAVPYEKNKTWEQYMLDDIELLFACDSIYMLNNWEDSKGARVECSIAKELSKTILFQEAALNEA